MVLVLSLTSVSKAHGLATVSSIKNSPLVSQAFAKAATLSLAALLLMPVMPSSVQGQTPAHAVAQVALAAPDSKAGLDAAEAKAMLFKAAHENSFLMLKEALASGKVDINVRSGGHTALHSLFVEEFPDWDFLKFMLAHGADPMDFRGGLSAYEFVDKIFEMTGDPRYSAALALFVKEMYGINGTKQGQTPLLHSLPLFRDEDTEITDWLIAEGADWRVLHDPLPVLEELSGWRTEEFFSFLRESGELETVMGNTTLLEFLELAELLELLTHEELQDRNAKELLIELVMSYPLVEDIVRKWSAGEQNALPLPVNNTSSVILLLQESTSGGMAKITEKERAEALFKLYELCVAKALGVYHVVNLLEKLIVKLKRPLIEEFAKKRSTDELQELFEWAVHDERKAIIELLGEYVFNRYKAPLPSAAASNDKYMHLFAEHWYCDLDATLSALARANTMLASGVSLATKDRTGRTLYDWAVHYYDTNDVGARLPAAAMAALLLKAMVGVDGKDDQGRTPMDWAKLTDNKTIQVLTKAQRIYLYDSEVRRVVQELEHEGRRRLDRWLVIDEGVSYQP